MTAPDLAYVALVVDNPDRVAEFYVNDLELQCEYRSVGGDQVPFVGVGETALALFSANNPFLGPEAAKGVHHIAVATVDPNSRAKDAFAELESEPTTGVDGRLQIELTRSDTCGVRVRLTEPLALHGGSSSSVERIDHLGVASADNAAAKHAFINRLGCVYESQQTDSEFETLSENFVSDAHGNIFHTRPTELRGSLRVTFITVGDCELEFLSDLTLSVRADEGQHNNAGNTRGDRSAIARYVQRRGQGLHHLALKTPNIDEVLARLHERGHRMIDRKGRPGSRRARIGFIHPSAVGGVLIHFVERKELT